MTNETKDNGEAFGLPSTKQKMHPYSQVLQWVAEGKEIEAFTGAQWITAVTSGILNAANHFGHPEYYQPQDFRLKSPRHVHQDLIDAFENGAKIQVLSKSTMQWRDSPRPYWFPTEDYRIKPEPKPDIIGYCESLENTEEVFNLSMGSITSRRWTGDNIKVVFCGGTNKLKSIELLEPQE